ncbi:bile acid-CoA:amino acid N-acyltransferase-like [Rhopilema esculentum]|uniref:bile acid-CoA:amino acid N-acyltransferase-like n=1 Tax=Rhopilema esculentum TaxID=499914 RepID=UPI0031D1E589|eukprot:gene12929-3684_t
MEKMLKQPEIIAPSGPVLVDQRIEIQVKNLRPFQHVTLRVELNSEKPVFFESYGHYIADKDGELNLSRDSSFGGTYKGIDNMGLFWSMLVAPGQRKGARFITKDVTKMMEFRVFLFDGHVMSQSNAESMVQALEKLPKALAKTAILRTYLAENVERVEISVGRIRGTLFVPKGNRKFPGVIDMFGTHGGLLEYRAAILASHGFVTLALAFFSYKDLPNGFFNLELEYFMEAAKWLASHDKVYSSGIGYIGVSYGGQIALHVSAECPFVKAVVAISSHNAIGIPVKYKGKILGFTKIFSREDIVITEDQMIITRDSFEKYAEELHSIEIPIEKIKGKIMIVAGEEDMSTNAPKCARRMQSRLKEYSKEPPTVLIYPGTGHLIEVPYMPVCSASYHSVVGHLIVWGGNIIEHSAAQEHAWHYIRSFLFENIQDVTSKL